MRIDALHESLLAGSPRGLEEAFNLFHQSITSRLSRRPRYRRADPQAVEDAVMEAILNYVAHPRSFDPSRGKSLGGYLEFAAERDLLNTLRTEQRRRRRQTKAAGDAARAAHNFVELSSPAGNLLEKERAVRSARERERAMALLADPADRKVFELRQAGERKTTLFADALGLAHLPAAEQRRAVKRAKDRIDKILVRGLRGRDDDGEACHG